MMLEKTNIMLATITPNVSEERRWDNRQVVSTLEKAWHYSKCVLNKETYAQISSYVRGGDPIDLMTVFDLGVSVKNYSNDLRRCITAMTLLVASVDALELGKLGKAFEYLDQAKSLVSAVDKKIQKEKVVR